MASMARKILESFFAGGRGFGVVADAGGEVICLGGELVGLFAGAGLLNRPVGGASVKLQTLVVEGGLDHEIARGAADAERRGPLFAVGAATRGDRAGGELQGELDSLFDAGEARSGRLGGDLRGEGGGLFAGDPADGVERVDAEIEERTASGELAVKPPAVELRAVEAALKALDLTDGARASDLANLLPHGIVLDAIGDHQLHVRLAAGVDHPGAFGGGDSHGLLAEDMLAGLGGADGVFGVHAVGQPDVDGIDLGIVRDLVEVLVVVDRFVRDSVELLKFRRLLRGVAADQRGDLAVRGERAGLHEDGRDIAKADGREAQGRRGLCAERQRRGGSDQERALGEGAAIDAIQVLLRQDVRLHSGPRR